MSTFLAYFEPVPGRIYPLVDTFHELVRRGHHVTVRTGEREVALLRSIGIDAQPLAEPLLGFEPTDWKARTRFGALTSALNSFGRRIRPQVADLEQAIATERPDVVLVDETSWGAAAAAERSGLPWAFCIASPPPFPSRDVPPFGLGLRPNHGVFGRVRDRLARPLAEGTLVRIISGHANPVRDDMGLPPVRSMGDIYLAAPLVLVFTAEPFEYHRSDWPPNVRLVGPGLWEPPATPPPWLDDVTQPLILVTCSTAFQNDRRLVEVACEAFAGQPWDVIVTTAGVDPAAFHPPANVRIERTLSHTTVLECAACLVCHGGMGVTQKALAHGVPVVAVPFGRDQPEVARRVEVARAGVRLPARKLTPQRLRTAVDEAIGLRDGAARIAAAFAATGGPREAANALDGLLVGDNPAVSPTTP